MKSNFKVVVLLKAIFPRPPHPRLDWVFVLDRDAWPFSSYRWERTRNESVNTGILRFVDRLRARV